MAANLKETERTVPALVRKIEGLFSDDEEEGRKVLTLATLHKLKGAEYDRVFFYRPELCPSKWARQEWQQLQEQNLMYVGFTRARLELMIEDASAKPAKEDPEDADVQAGYPFTRSNPAGERE